MSDLNWGVQVQRAEARVAELTKGLERFLGMTRKGITGPDGIRAWEVSVRDINELVRLLNGTPADSVCAEPTPDAKTCVLERGHSDFLGHWSHDAGGMLRTHRTETAQCSSCHVRAASVCLGCIVDVQQAHRSETPKPCTCAHRFGHFSNCATRTGSADK